MRKRSGAFMLGLLLALGVAATGSPAAAAEGEATIVDPHTGTFTLADGTIATATLSGGERIFGEQGKSLGDWSGTDAMYADGVSAKDLPTLVVHSTPDCGSAPRCGEGQLTITFDRPVDDPAIHIAEFGAGTGRSDAGWASADGIRFASADGGATRAVVSDGATFTDGGDGYMRGDVRISCSAATNPGGCGSLTVPGTGITRIVFDMARFALSAEQRNGLDGYALGVTATATETPAPPAPPAPAPPAPEPVTMPALTLSKSVDRPVAGHDEPLSYTVVVGNAGTAAAKDVPVADLLPAGLTDVEADQGGVVADGEVRWTLPEVPAGGEVVLHVTGRTPAGLAEAQLVNRATVQNPADAPTGTPAPTVATPCPDDPQQACALTAVGALASLEIDKTVAQTTASAGSILDYTITVSNDGPGTATLIPVVDDLPDGARFIAASAGGVAVKDRVGWIVPEILPGQSATLTLRAQVPPDAEGTVVNRATVAYDETMAASLKAAAVQAGIAVPADLSALPALPPLTAAHVCADDAQWSCAVTVVRAPAAGLAQTGGTPVAVLPALALLAGGAVLLLVSARRSSHR